MNSPATSRRTSDARLLWWAIGCAVAGVTAQALAWQSLLTNEVTATSLLSSGLWQTLVGTLGGQIAVSANADGSAMLSADVDFLPLFALWLLLAGVSWCLAARLVRRTTHVDWRDSLTTAGFAFGWWWLMGVWEFLRLLAFSLGLESVERFLLVSPQFWMATSLAGWLAQPFCLRAEGVSPPVATNFSRDLDSSRTTLTEQTGGLTPPARQTTSMARRISPLAGVFLLIAVYVVVFTAMNWRLWFNLRIPHGDSAMYEEHLWNLTHGKGFRSFLDQGLFLGEHIQVVHLLLLPLHAIWPSHLLLELCESTALALGAIPVFRMTQRSTDSTRAALLMAGAYLLYFPLHFLDIEVDLKTFRPESFCVPFFLFAFEALEQARWRRAVVLLLFAMSAKEDYSIIIAPLGVWLAARAVWERRTTPSQDHDALRQTVCKRNVGIALAVLGAVYLVLATRVVIPWFRGGAELHYAKYFSKFGDTLEQIAWNMLTNPGLLFGELITVKTVLYALAMLMPVGFVALLSPGRLAVGVPLFGILCLNELAQDPRHHFHAPLVPVVFWATAMGVGRAGAVWRRLVDGWQRLRLGSRWSTEQTTDHAKRSPLAFSVDSFARQFVWTSAFASGLFLSMSPAGIAFWDAHASTSLWQLYRHDPRADEFPKVFAQIPREAAVASTDFMHPRFTHHRRSYDYSHYRRRVAGYEERVPDDTDFIVIDTRHPYSDIKSPNEVRELREHPDQWELLPDETRGYFIVLRRK